MNTLKSEEMKMPFEVRKPGDVLKMNHRRGFSIVLYGPPLVGKTTTLANDPDCRVCLIDFDKNTTTVEESDNVTIIHVDSIEEYFEVKKGVDEGIFTYPGGQLVMDFDLYVVDSFTTFEEKMKKWVAEIFVPTRAREVKGRFGAQSDWEDLQRHELDEVRDWQAMTKRLKNPINIMWIGHDMTLLNDMGQAYATAIMLQGKYVGPRIISAVDAVFYMSKIRASDGKLYRGIYTQDHSIFRADARIPIHRRDDLASIIYNPKWGEVLEAMGYEKEEAEEK
jgi:hypothetical protein